MLEILFIDAMSGLVKYGVADVSRIRYITPSEIGFDVGGRERNCSFRQDERIEVSHKTDNPMRVALMKEVSHV